MSEAAYQMVLNAINAFVKQDVKLARSLMMTIDAQFNDVMASVTEQIKNDSIDSQYAAIYVMVAGSVYHHCEAEWTYL